MKRLLLVFALALAPQTCVSAQIPQAIQPMVKRSVFITNQYGSGSGVILETGLVLTAAHMFGPDLKVEGQNAEVLKADTLADLMLLRVKTDQVPILVFDIRPAILDPVLSVSNMAGKRNYISTGFITWIGDVINTSTQVLPGASGSAVYDERMALVGLVVAGEGNCQFGFPIPRLVPAKKILVFLRDTEGGVRSSEVLLRFKERVRALKVTLCSDDHSTRRGDYEDEWSWPPSESNDGGNVQGQSRDTLLLRRLY